METAAPTIEIVSTEELKKEFGVNGHNTEPYLVHLKDLNSRKDKGVALRISGLPTDKKEVKKVKDTVRMAAKELNIPVYCRVYGKDKNILVVTNLEKEAK